MLGVDKNASPEEIKKAFKKLALEHHPDRPSGNEAKFKEINEAYQVLGDAEKRKRFDQFGSDFEQQGGFGGGNWDDFMRAARGGQGGDFSGGIDLGDIFGDIFGGGRGGRGQPNRGRDIQVDVEIDFKEAAFGVERELSLRKQAACDVCGGNGAEPGSKLDTCPTCKGQGQMNQAQRTFFGTVQTIVTCPDCRGQGKKPSKKCQHCGGDGILPKTVTVKVKIPAGIDDGQSIRVTGHGEAAPHGGASGDLYVAVHVRSSKIFERDGVNVYTDNEINFAQAAMGDTIKVETIEGAVNVVVPEGTESGQLIRLRGKGIPHLGGSARGDHYVRVKIRVPKKLSKNAKRLLDELKGEI